MGTCSEQLLKLEETHLQDGLEMNAEQAAVIGLNTAQMRTSTETNVKGRPELDRPFDSW